MCVTLVRMLVYCNFLSEVRLGGWGSEGPTLGQYVSACAIIPLGSGSIMRFEIRYFFLEIGLSPYTFPLEDALYSCARTV